MDLKWFEWSIMFYCQVQTWRATWESYYHPLWKLWLIWHPSIQSTRDLECWPILIQYSASQIRKKISLKFFTKIFIEVIHENSHWIFHKNSHLICLDFFTTIFIEFFSWKFPWKYYTKIFIGYLNENFHWTFSKKLQKKIKRKFRRKNLDLW